MAQHHPAIAAILARRSIRAFTNAPVSDDMVRTILEAAMAAPSAVGRDPWHFVVVTSQQMRDSVATALPNGKMLSSAQVAIVVCGDLEAAHDHHMGYLIQDCSAAVENALLAASALGLGAVWLGVYPREERVEALRAMLNLPSAVLPVACLAIGHPAESKEPRTRYAESKVHRGCW